MMKRKPAHITVQAELVRQAGGAGSLLWEEDSLPVVSPSKGWESLDGLCTLCAVLTSIPLLQIVNLIEETGHFNVTNTTFDFDLFSLDETTVRKLQSYLEAVAT